MKQNEVSVKLADLRATYANASEETKKALVALYGKEPFAFDYHEIKTFADACERLGISSEIPAQRANVAYDKEAVEQSMALYQLLVIQRAINDGVWCDEDGDQWFPYWVLYSKEEMAEMSDADKERKGISQLLSCADADLSEFAGVRCAYADYRGANTYAGYGFPFVYNSKETALYAAQQFESLFFKFYGIKLKEGKQ